MCLCRDVQQLSFQNLCLNHGRGASRKEISEIIKEIYISTFIQQRSFEQHGQ